MIVDDIDRHLPAAGSLEKASVPLGMFLAWCVNLGLTRDSLGHDALGKQAQDLIVRLKYREITGSELLVAGCAGQLHSRDLTSEGQQFVEGFYNEYMPLFTKVFGADVYAVKDDWTHYDKIAKPLTQRLLGSAAAGKQGKSWWKFWK